MTFEPLRVSSPLPGFRFAVTFTLTPSAGAIASGGGIVPVQAGFSEVSGLGATIELHTYQEGGRNDRVLKFPTRADYGNITFRRGVTVGREIYDWFDMVRRGSFGSRRSILIAHLDERAEVALVWFVFRALPVSYTGPVWDAGQNAVAVESLEIAHEGIELVPGSDFAVEGAQTGR
jgi:phage tail-like protein